jgi:hypothetical protein
VRSTGLRTGFRGSYRFALSQVDTLPEGVPVALAIGDTVRSSAAWPWDIDTYELTTSALDTILVALGADDGDPLELMQATLVNVATGARIPLSPEHVIGYARVELPAGRYALRVERRSDRWAPGTRADYAVAVRRVSAAPESHAVAIALADTVRESSGFMGDIDDFVLEATPGQLVNVAFGNPGGLPALLMLTLSDAATGTLLTRRGGQFPVQYTAPVQVPASGAIRVRVCVPDDCLWYGAAGPYWLVALPIDRSPESRAATFAIGDVVQGEAIERPGDLDEFTFTAGAGATITVLFEGWPVGPEPIRLEVVDPQDGTVLGHIDRSWLANDSPPSELGLTLPRAGTWMVRVQAMPNAWGHEGHGAYRFRVVAR